MILLWQNIKRKGVDMKKHSLFLSIALLLIFFIGCSEVTDSPNVSPSKNDLIATSSTPINSTILSDEPSTSTPSGDVALVSSEMPATIPESNITPQTSEVHSLEIEQADSAKEQSLPTDNKTSATDSGVVANSPEKTVQETETQKVTVYITESGEKYHRDGCQYLQKSKTQISLDDAKNRGYIPCKKCNPPQ